MDADTRKLIMDTQTASTTIASGQTLSGIMFMKGASVVGLTASLVTSAVVYLQGSVDDVIYSRVFKEDGTGQFVWSVGSGDASLGAVNVIGPFPFFKFETDPSQNSGSNFAAIMKF